MHGSIFYNFWAGLIGFTYYFFVNLSDQSIPIKLLLSSLLVATVVFLLMFPIRVLIAYILITKENELPIEHAEMEAGTNAENSHLNIGESTKETPTENPDEIANVVRTMMNQEQPATNNS